MDSMRNAAQPLHANRRVEPLLIVGLLRHACYTDDFYAGY